MGTTTSTTETTTNPTAEAVVTAYLEELTAGRLGTTDLLAPDAAFVATVPHWRYRVDGADAVRKELGSWYGVPSRIVELRRLPVADGEVLDLGLSWEEGGEPWGGHQLQIVTVRDGRIAQIDAACGGRWGPQLLAQLPAGAHAG
jgi:hypothetical protein